jgi:hypothetical protein
MCRYINFTRCCGKIGVHTKGETGTKREEKALMKKSETKTGEITG